MDLHRPEGRIHGMKRRAFLVAAAAPLVVTAVARPTLAARSGGGVVALVTADLESHLVAVDVDSGRILERIPTAPGPRSVEAAPSGRRSSPIRRTAGLSIVDTARLAVVGEIGGLGEPRYTAMHPSERLAYVSDSKRGSIVVVDLDRRRSSRASPFPARHAISR